MQGKSKLKEWTESKKRKSNLQSFPKSGTLHIKARNITLMTSKNPSQISKGKCIYNPVVKYHKRGEVESMLIGNEEEKEIFKKILLLLISLS